MLILIISIMFGVLLGTGLSMLGILFVLRFIEHGHLPPHTTRLPHSKKSHA